MENEKKILIVDDHQMFIDGLKALLRKQNNFNVVAEELCAEAALERIKKGGIDIVITDISMIGMNGIELTRLIKNEFSEIKVLLLSMHNDYEIVSDAIMCEADGFILKNTGKQELISALEKISDNGTFYSHEVLSIMMQKVKKEKKICKEIVMFTEREIEILCLICDDFSSQQIADKLFISRRTVDTHRFHIMEKTKAKTIIGLIKFAVRNDLVKI
ncbi:MAG TPA: DNA-binding response regulator [Bacteroidales bacterium]|nr:MAG: hypothetical protein A2W98_03765 [Bacteroidetes bacterium GWF2_33_38]OFY91678.1 MAG: hypothetical protein A2236_12375 [Bacteroidetes bacterium RIFOXYA2_FULL_33_7]HBF87536.1 DNA-binding response regulator [Bacteroidales bacterium]